MTVLGTEDRISTHLAEPLTPREREVTLLLMRGYTAQEIGRELFMACGTVKAHTAVIFHKFGVTNRTQAAITAMNLGIK